MRERLSASPLLRVVAASLVLHLVALPVLALYLYRRDEAPRLEISIQPAIPEDAAAPEEDPAASHVVPTDVHLDAVDGPGSDRIENGLRRARFVLSTARGPVLAVVFDELEGADPRGSLERNLLGARTRLLAQREWSNWLDDTERWGGATALGRALWVEVLLDRFVLEGIRSPMLGPALNDVQLTLDRRRGRIEDAGSEEAIDLLFRECLERARSYGAWEAPVGFDPAAVPLPLRSAWFAVLERAFADASLGSEPALSRFRGWIR